jgi:hypothetical protein
MEQLSLYLKISQLNLIIGAIAFVMTTLHVVLTFPVFSYVIAKHNYLGTRLLVTSFLTGIITYGLWLVYVWPFENLFMIVALGLWILTYVVFLIQTIVERRKSIGEKFKRG